MTYQEIKTKVLTDSFRLLWDSSDDEARSFIANQIQRYGGQHTIKMLTDVDKSLHTSAKDLVEALQRRGFPQDKLKVTGDNKAQIELAGQPCTFSSSQLGHSYLYDNNNPRRFLDFIHTPADIVADYLVERYCSDNWLEEEIQRRMAIFKEFQKKERKKVNLRTRFYNTIELLKEMIMSERNYEKIHHIFFKTGRDYYKFLTPDSLESAIDEQLTLKWEDTVNQSKKEIKEFKKRQAARERYEKVTKPKLQAKKQAVLEEKRALLREYKKEYGVVCRFIHVRGYHYSAVLFVVPAINDQVVSFNVPDVFNRDDYDRAMKLVAFLNELTEKYGKTKVQKKGGLPKEASDALQSVLEELKLSRMWKGIYNESQRRYLHRKYIDSVDIK